VREDVGRLDIFVDEAPGVESPERHREADGHAQKVGQLKRVPQERLEDLAAGIHEQERQPPLVPHQRHGPRRPGRIQRIPQRIGVLEPPQASQRGMLRGGGHHQERGPVTLPPAPRQDELPILP
jgi:hypothetical protein